jgi:hypothetical protein
LKNENEAPKENPQSMEDGDVKCENKLGLLCEEGLDHTVLRLESKDNVSLSVILFKSKNSPKL